MTESIANPILNSPYEQPDGHFVIGSTGPTGEIGLGRRPSESFIPIAATLKGKRLDSGAVQDMADFDITGERRQKNTLINDLRREVGRWREGGLSVPDVAWRVSVSPAATCPLDRSSGHRVRPTRQS